MKKLLKALMLVIVTFSISGCFGKSQEEDANIVTSLSGPVEIEFWHGLSGQLEQELQSLTDEFNQSQPNITVKLVNQGSYSDLNSKLTTAAQSKNLPTLTMGYGQIINQLNQDNLVTDLNSYLNHSEIGIDTQNYIDAFLEEGNFDGQQLSIPFNKSTEILIYNEDELNKYNLSVPTSWDEVLEVAKSYYEQTGKPGIGFDSPSNLFASLLRDAGVETWVDNGEVTFNNAEFEELLNRFAQAGQAGYIRLAGEDKYMSTPFGNQDVLMYVGSSAGISFVDSAVNGKFNWATAAYPGENAIQQGPSIFMFNTVSPEQQFAGYEYIKFMTSDEITTRWAEATGYLPVTKKAIESEEYQNVLAKNPKLRAAYDQRDKLEVLTPVFDGSQELTTLTGELITAIITGGSDVKTELENLTQQAQQVIDLA